MRPVITALYTMRRTLLHHDIKKISYFVFLFQILNKNVSTQKNLLIAFSKKWQFLLLYFRVELQEMYWNVKSARYPVFIPTSPWPFLLSPFCSHVASVSTKRYTAIHSTLVFASQYQSASPAAIYASYKLHILASKELSESLTVYWSYYHQHHRRRRRRSRQ